MNFQMAKYYYNRLRSHLKKNSLELPPESRFMNDPIILSLHQIGLGIGPDSQERRSYSSELFVFASLNLLTILSFEIKTSTKEEGFLLKSSLKKDILSDLYECGENFFISDSILNTTIQLFRVVYGSATLSETKETVNTRENAAIISSIMMSGDLMSQITSNYPMLAAMLFYLSSYCTSDSTVVLKNLQASYYYAKLSKNLKLLSLISFHIYELMKRNDDGVFSIEEINDQKLKYLNYFDMYRERYAVEVPLERSRVSEPGSEGGLYDNEKNDDYYDKTAADMSVISTT